ncbi:MAG TPA: twin-arginine translocase subunit TatC [Sedimentisphaerales bacterium]|nr:twin-arginine translocase subunit TatC [Sedimentisphaerales bacterium]
MARTKKKLRDPHDTTMSLGDHLDELRARLILAIIGLVLGSIVCLILGPYLIRFIELPYANLKVKYNLDDLKVLAPADAFMAYMKISMIAGLILSSPWVFYQLWMFVAAGLYQHERRYVRTTVPFSVILFVAGAMFFLFAVAPLSLAFFLKFGRFINVEPAWTLGLYVSFITTLMLVFGLGFQTPIAMFILNKTGLVSLGGLRKSRRYVLLGIFVVAAIATPGPDVISQVALAIPLYSLFELGILLCRLSERKKMKKEKEKKKEKECPPSQTEVY